MPVIEPGVVACEAVDASTNQASPKRGGSVFVAGVSKRAAVASASTGGASAVAVLATPEPPLPPVCVVAAPCFLRPCVLGNFNLLTGAVVGCTVAGMPATAKALSVHARDTKALVAQLAAAGSGGAFDVARALAEHAPEQAREWALQAQCAFAGVTPSYGFVLASRVEPVSVAHVMARADGNLRAWLHERVEARLSPQELRRERLAVLAQVARTLAFLHDVHNVVHRGIKPSNVLVNWRVAAAGQLPAAQLTDVGQRSTAKLTSYAAPEQLIADDSSDHCSSSADVWSLGMLMLGVFGNCLDAPWGTMTDAQMGSRMERRVQPSVPESVPAAVRAVIAHCLQYDANQRWSARQVAAALDKLLVENGNAAIGLLSQEEEGRGGARGPA